MSLLEFLLGLLKLISFDCLLGFLIWILYKYIDYKYLSQLDIVTLKEENKFLKQQNKSFNGTSTFFDEDDNL